MRVLYLMLLFVVLSTAQSQITIQVKQVSSDANIEMADFPYVTAYIKGYDGGNVTVVDAQNLLIMENGYTIEPFSEGKDGEWQIIKWKTKRTNFAENEAYYPARIYWSLNNKVTYTNVIGKYIDYPILKVFDDNVGITDISYGDIPPGNAVPFVVKINGFRKEPFNLEEYPIHLDSVTTETEFFEVEWMGSDGDTDWSPPPRDLRTDSKYWIKVIFKPTQNIPYRDKLVFHYEGGFRKVIPLKGNSLVLPHETVLNIVEPNGGETFTPCETVKIKWIGQSNVNPVKIHYSIDGGNNWTFIESVSGETEYEWKVPANISNNVKLKVSQDFKNTKEFLMSEDNFTISNANYHIDGNKAVTINQKGKILEWDFTQGENPQIITRVQLNPNDSSAFYESTGINYLSEDEFTVLYRVTTQPGYLQFDTLAYFRTGENQAYKKVVITKELQISKMIADGNYDNYYAYPDFGTELFIIDPSTGNIDKRMSFNYLINDISISSNNVLSVLLMNNELKYFDLNNNNSIIQSIKYPDLRWLQAAQISQNGNYTAIAEYQVQSGQAYSSYLVDNDSHILARQFTPASSEVVGYGFNLTSTTLAIGSQNQPQILLYDLTGASSKIQIPGHATSLHKMVLSPTGKSLLTLASNSSDNIYYRTFTNPESDETDATFRIVKPEITEDNINIDADYLGNETVYTISTIQNEGERFIDIENLKFMFGVNFKVVGNWTRDTLGVGEYTNIKIAFKPVEPGIIYDTLVFSTCIYDLKVPFQSEGYPRNLTFFNNPYDFGEVCVGETKESQMIDLFRNDDPVPLEINNFIFNTGQFPFSIPYFPQDTVIPPGGIFKANIVFNPREIKDYEAKLAVFYADQQIQVDTFYVKGKGIGSVVEYSHNQLLFIPELPQREISIKNIGGNSISILDAYTNPEGYFVASGNFPINLAPGEEGIIYVEQIADYDGFVELLIDANPCLSQKSIYLGRYEGESLLAIPEIITKPTDDVEIPITFKNTENGDYNGERKFTAEFEIYYKLFFPLEALSDLGTAEITKNEVNGQLRTVGVSVNGEFPPEGTVVKVKGKPGLTDILEGDIRFVENDNIWGTSIINAYSNGKLIIDDECVTKVVKESNTIDIGSISPNPADEIFEVQFNSLKNTYAIIEIINSAGQIVLKTDKLDVKKGSNTVSLNISYLPPGNYTLYVKAEGEFTSKVVIISR